MPENDRRKSNESLVQNQNGDTSCSNNVNQKVEIVKFSSPSPSSHKKIRDKQKHICNNFKSMSVIVTSSIENCFYILGKIIANNPCKTVLLCWVLCLMCSGGLGKWKTITDNEYLWTPYGSEFIEQKEWIEKNFPRDSRVEIGIITGDNVLTAKHMQFLLDIYQRISNSSTMEGNIPYSKICLKDPQSEDESCLSQTVLKIWNNDPVIIRNLTDEKVIRDVSQVLKDEKSLIAPLFSNVTFHPHTKLAKSSKAMLSFWFLKDEGKKVTGQASYDPVALDWETVFVNILFDMAESETKPEGAVLNGVGQKSFNEEIDEAVKSNMSILAIGCSLIFIYIALVLGQMNSLEQRVILSLMGVLVIGMAIASSYGVCFYFGFFFADMHPIIPFLLLGIGVDDMFIIVKSMENLTEEQLKLPVKEKIALALKHGGVSITVTSLTDMSAFLIGSTSSLPILRHFCLFCATGVLFLYIYAVTFFVGCLTLDELRIRSRKVFPCFKPKPATWKPNEFSKKHLCQIFFDKYISHYIFKLPVKILFLVVTVALFSVGLYGVTQLETDYNPVWYMRESSYQRKFYEKMVDNFPDFGATVSVFVGKIAYWKNLDEMNNIQDVLANSSYLRKDSIHYWFPKFYNEYCLKDINEESSFFESDGFDSDFFGEDSGFGVTSNQSQDCSDEKYFKTSFLFFLNDNRQFYPDFKFNISIPDANRQDLLDGKFEITASRATYQHNYLPNTTIQNIAMDEIKESMIKIQFNQEGFKTPIVYSFMYIQWEANKLMSKELIRNLTLTFSTIGVVSLFLVANVQVALLVMLSVVFTIVDVAGYAYFMGLTIEIVTSMLLILSCGLALDYAAHIGVSYACSRKSTRQERAKESLVSMGAPVFHGGFSTFVAFALLITSDSYIFVAFFQVFGMVVLFGLFHGLIFLPIVLSIVGPELYPLSGQSPPKASTSNGIEVQNLPEKTSSDKEHCDSDAEVEMRLLNEKTTPTTEAKKTTTSATNDNNGSKNSDDDPVNSQ